MRSSLISRSPFRSSTSALALLLASTALLTAACGDDGAVVCGTDDAGSEISVTGTQANITFSNLTSLPGNDCPADGVPPEVVVSVSIENDREADGTLFTICIPRPDQLLDGPRTLGDSQSDADIRFFDVGGNLEGCACTSPPCGYSLDREMPITGSATASGVCEDANHPAGFALDFDASLSLRRACDDTVESLPVSLVGRVAVTLR